MSAVAVLAGCATSPASGPAAVEAPREGQVLGRSDRFVIYDPGPDDTLASIASRFLGAADRFWVVADFNDVDHVTAGRPVAVPLGPLNPWAVHATDVQTVPILCYHRFGPGKNKMIVSPTQFAAQLDWLERNDYRVIPMKQLQGFLAGTDVIPKRAVVITIDDGHESAYQYAVPLLRKHGFPATFFVYTDFVGSGGGLTWSQLQEMAKVEGFEIGAHSKSHRNLLRGARESDAAYRKVIEGEVKVPIEVLGHHLGVSIDAYAFPYGDTNDIVLNLLAKDRIALAATVTPGGNAFFMPPTLLHRTMIFGDYDLEAFKSKLQVSRRIGES